MTREQFNVLIEKMEEVEHKLLVGKGKEYTRRSKDILANFKRGAKEHPRLNPMDVWLIYFNKHVDSINTYIYAKGETTSDEPIQSRIKDARNYLMLFAAMVDELEKLGFDEFQKIQDS